MQNINIDPAQVRRAAANLRMNASQLKNNISLFNDIEDEIENSWKSRYTRSYTDILEKTERKIRNTISSLETIADNLIRIASDVERTEKELQDIMAKGTASGGGFR